MSTNRELFLNDASKRLCRYVSEHAVRLRVASHRLESGAELLDFGCRVHGGIEAGILLAKICMSDRADVSLQHGNSHVWTGPWVQVTTDSPVEACMASQYAGWPVQHEKYFAMGSGPMRAKRGKEHVLKSLSISDTSTSTVGVLESDVLPDDSVCKYIATESNSTVDQLCVCVAPTRSIAGVLQVVARSVETAIHKMFELGFDFGGIVSAYGVAPLPPVARDFAKGIGRTNDAILYGGHVTLWVDTLDETIESLGPRIPSCASKDFGEPFSKIFKRYNYDFYQVDPGLFSPAVVTLVNLASGKSWKFGTMRSDIIADSFGETVS